ncbi:hypothetical protein Leryth_021225 [Lithospermum erythrorhizon]|nr:hypothetical protein Leryth_021225 [Lithospermum erythrorhizon]
MLCIIKLEIPKVTFGGTMRMKNGTTNYISSTLKIVSASSNVLGEEFPYFLPKEIHKVKDPLARSMAKRIQRLPVDFSKHCIMSSCLKPSVQNDANPVVLLHSFDSSCLEWRCTYPLLEEAGLETWAIDVLGWGFSDLGTIYLMPLIFSYDLECVFTLCVCPILL